MTPTPKSHRLRLDTGLSYHVLEWGADDPDLDHTLVLVHGFLDLSWGWAETASAGLAGRFHVVAPDMRGHGDSDRVGPGGYYHFLDYAADLASVVGTLGRRRVSIVGHSMGGMVSTYYVGAHPERVERLALLEGLGPPESDIPGPDRVRRWIDSWRRALGRTTRSYADVAEAAARLRKNDPRLAEPLSVELARRGTRQLEDGRVEFKHDPVHTTRGPTPFLVDRAAEFWQRIRCPVLLVDGADSRFRYADEDDKRRRAQLPHARHEVLPGAGHMMQRHAPRALAALLSGFFGEQAPERTAGESAAAEKK